MEIHFKPIVDFFSSLPETGKPMKFAVDQEVTAPSNGQDGEMQPCTIVHAEKGHYLLENDTGHITCSEKELASWGNITE